MIEKLGVSTKRSLISKDNSTILLAIAVASFITVFCLVASFSLFGQSNYQRKVIGEQRKAQKTLKANVAAATSLKKAYEDFNNTPETILGGPVAPEGSPDRIDNAQIILDALPSKYDFPALTASLEKILSSGGFPIEGITGTDNEVSALQSSGSPAPVEIPFQLTTSGSYDSLRSLMETFQKSIRPFVTASMELSGSDNKLRLSLSSKTYYQPAKVIENKQKVIK